MKQDILFPVKICERNGKHKRFFSHPLVAHNGVAFRVQVNVHVTGSLSQPILPMVWFWEPGWINAAYSVPKPLGEDKLPFPDYLIEYADDDNDGNLVFINVPKDSLEMFLKEIILE